MSHVGCEESEVDPVRPTRLIKNVPQFLAGPEEELRPAVGDVVVKTERAMRGLGWPRGKAREGKGIAGKEGRACSAVGGL